ncbi:cytochrome C oxidase subunit III [Stigmatella sp. ncwal1]|uniref:Cytochrome C oxidase subunit III n=1 Tax=Stigmatella ashevillensis TaxID=2995309 RepID=A0ABT5DEW4_9BACT|nr:cytochrome C oxidase subunit III [Stigmatella ashevillena]MDC0712215.1 cytochrome C oxidase subunit III [Stigmatella ashevillena]
MPSQGPLSLPPGANPEASVSTSGGSNAQDAATASFGVTVGLLAWGMFFAALAFAVGYLRMRAPWPPAGMPSLPRILPALGVGLLGAAAGLLHFGARQEHVRGYVAAALGAQVGFLAVQGFVLSTLWQGGLRLPEGGAYASAVHGLGALHAAHGVAGVMGLALRGFRRGEVRGAVKLWALYGDFLAATGVLFLVAVYLT